MLVAVLLGCLTLPVSYVVGSLVFQVCTPLCLIGGAIWESVTHRRVTDMDSGAVALAVVVTLAVTVGGAGLAVAAWNGWRYAVVVAGVGLAVHALEWWRRERGKGGGV